MEINISEDALINWNNIKSEMVNGTHGFVSSKMIEFANFKIRELVFSKQYEADHWCEKGHVIFVLDGELIIEYNDHTLLKIKKGQTLVLGDQISSHKAKTELETKVWILD